MKHRTRVLALTILLVSSNTFAAERSGGNWQVGASAGSGYFDIDSDPLADRLFDSQPTSAESSSVAYSLYAEYAFNPYFSLQGAYTDFGSVRYEKKYQCTTPGFACLHMAFAPIRGRFYAQGYGLMAKGTLPLNQSWEFFGSVGASYVEYRNRAPEVPGISGHRGIDRSSEKWSPKLQLGILWQFATQWSTQLAVDGTWDVSDTSTTGKADLYTLSLGIDYRFGQAAR